MPLVQILAGVLLLTMGRRLFWLFVGCLGFLAGLRFSDMVLGPQTDLVSLAFAIFLGVLGAFLAIFLQRVAVAVAGFIAGAHSIVNLAAMLGLGVGYDWLLYLVGGVAGALLLSLFFDSALIVLSSLAGASILAQFTGLGPAADLLAFAFLFVIGLFAQSRSGLPARPPSRQVHHYHHVVRHRD